MLRKILVGFVCNAPLPVMVFVGFGYHEGEPTFDRWVEAYKLCAPIAAVHMLLLLALKRPFNRIVLGGNIYLLAGGLAVLANQTWFLEALDVLQETGMMIAIVMLGLVSTFSSSKGYVGVISASETDIRFYSLLLLGVALALMVMSIPFRGHPFIAGFMPLLVLISLQKIFAARIDNVPVNA